MDVPRTPIVATGRSREGVRWELLGGPADGEFGTFLRVETERGMVGGGGHYGPIRLVREATSISVHRWWPGAGREGGVHYLVGRVRADVARVDLHLVGVQPAVRSLVPVRLHDGLEFAFVADVLPAGADLVHIAVFDGEGRTLEDADQRLHAAVLRGELPEEFRREQ